MANPVITTIPVGQWIKVINASTTGAIWPLKNLSGDGSYVSTLRDAAGAAPTNGVLTEAKELPWSGTILSSSISRDVYVAVTGQTAGSVRVDL